MKPHRSASFIVAPLLIGLAALGPGLAQTPPQPVAAGAEMPVEAPVSESGVPLAEGATLSMQVGPVEPTVQGAPANASAAVPHDLSPWGMFMAADMVVKTVMVGLALASVATWTVWLAKSLELIGSTRRLRRAAKALATVPNLAAATEALVFATGPAAEMVRSAAAELRVSDGAAAGVKERVASRLERIEIAAGRKMMKGTGILATIGSVAPFVGLFGTVWGIMNAFIGISKANTTNLAVVAPGIAEALLATAIGLVAAIPAVVIYNAFARSIAGYRVLVADLSAEIQRIVSRDMDRERRPRAVAVK